MESTRLTMRDVLENDDFHATIAAEQAGLGRKVVWAHACDLIAPWRWVSTDELLLSNGTNVPSGAEAQVQFIQSLHRAGVCGVILPVITGSHNPKLTDEALAVADQLAFPVLQTVPQLSWSKVVRYVAAKNAESEQLDLLLLSKILAISVVVETPQVMLQQIARLLKVHMSVYDERTGLLLLNSETSLHEPDPHPIREPETYTVLLKTIRPVTLEIELTSATEVPESFIRKHIVPLVETLTNRVLTRLERFRSECKTTLRSDLPEPPFRVLVCERDELDRFALAVGLGVLIKRNDTDLGEGRLVRVVVGDIEGEGRAWVPPEAVPSVKELLRDLQIAAGVSDVFKSSKDVAAATSQARNAFQQTRSDELWREYRGQNLQVLARSYAEAREIAETVLGGLIERTAKRQKLLATLTVYLENDRSWERTARALGVHRQTLAHRLHQIEEITGRDTTRVADLSELWIATRAWKEVASRTEV